MAQVWAASGLVDYGSDACIRCVHTGLYPIVKIALPQNEEARRRLRHEYEILGERSKLSLPIPKVDLKPLTDEDGIFGYKLEKLFRLQLSELSSRAKDIEASLDRLHCSGFAHGDLHPSNIMKNKDGEIRFIDFSNSGRLGHPVAPGIPSWVYKHELVHKMPDTSNLARFLPVH
ncbi:hypothetical protein BDV97DRAFT_62150 [Delphinella strobiligena]|nr:hypothetical protein BDV97DRAFT_62150 [Delphinella strobiligena]